MTLLSSPFIRYGISGGSAALIDISSVYIATSLLGVHYSISLCIGFLLASSWNYLISSIWVFKKKSKTHSKSLSLFIAIGFIGLCISILGVSLLVEYSGIWYLYAKIIMTGIVFIWNYTARKKIIFDKIS